MIHIHKDHLLIACKYLHRVVPRKPTLPALSCVLVEPTLTMTRLVATDLERTASISIPTGNKLAAIRAKQAGKILVDCGVLANAAATADTDTFLALTRDQIHLTLGGQPSTIPITIDKVADDLGDPTAKLVGDDWLHVGGAIFDPDAVKRLLRCVSRDESRFVLQGINWDKAGQLVATDGRRLHTEPFTPLPDQVEASIIIPTATCGIIPPRAAVSLKLGNCNHIAFVATENILTIRIFSRLIEGHFPNWRQVLPESSPNMIRINNQQAADHLRKISKGATGKDGTTTLEVGQGKITFHVRKDTPIGTFTLPAIITGTPTSITFNTKFLIDALDNGGDSFSYRDEMCPATITGVKRNQHILMPMRLGHNTPPAPEPEQEEEEEAYATN